MKPHHMATLRYGDFVSTISRIEPAGRTPNILWVYNCVFTCDELVPTKLCAQAPLNIDFGDTIQTCEKAVLVNRSDHTLQLMCVGEMVYQDKAKQGDS